MKQSLFRLLLLFNKRLFLEKTEEYGLSPISDNLQKKISWYSNLKLVQGCLNILAVICTIIVFFIKYTPQLGIAGVCAFIFAILDWMAFIIIKNNILASIFRNHSEVEWMLDAFNLFGFTEGNFSAGKKTNEEKIEEVLDMLA